MRKLLLFAALLFMAMQGMAADVDALSAQSLAQRFLMSQAARNGFNVPVAPTVKWMYQELNSTNANKAAYYVVNTDNGFVIVAGDDRAQQILAYGERPLNDMNALPENMKFWLENYKGQIEYLQAHPGLVVEQPKLTANRIETIEPMLEAKWDQGYPYYNQCPMDGDRRGLTGCATTSLAQVFYKWQYPTEPTPEVPGYTTRTRKFVLPPLPSITFDWANMLPMYNFSANDTQRNAVAWLMRYIGQAEEMDYTNEGSEAWEDDILRACHLFGYVNARVEYKATLNFDTNGENVIINDADWNVMLQEELAAGRPVVYCAYSYSNAYNTFYGHAFNVDGYDASNGMYSINWGWSGTGNGYFALRAFSNQGYSYNLGELMVMGIEPPAPIEAYDPVMLSANEDYITLTSFRADWTDETPDENVSSYTLEVNTDNGTEPGVYEKVFTETFPYCSENGTRELTKIDNLCTNKGWDFSHLYENRRGLRLGGNGCTGSLTTPALDMTQSGGKMTVVVTMLPFSNDTDVPVIITCGNSMASVTVSAENNYIVVLDCEPNENQKVTFATTESSKRVVIAQIDIYSATADAAKMVYRLSVEEGDSTSRVITDITNKFYTVNNLTAGGTFTYRVRAYYVNGTKSAWSNIETVTLVDNGPAPHDFEVGDVNHNGEVGISDVSALIDYLLDSESSPICTICADVDGNNDVTIADVSALIDILLSL